MNDCVMLNKIKPGPDHCKALNVRACPEGCRFYKDRATSEDDSRRAGERLKSLPLREQARIAEMYYDGYLPWHRKQEGR